MKDISYLPGGPLYINCPPDYIANIAHISQETLAGTFRSLREEFAQIVVVARLIDHTRSLINPKFDVIPLVLVARPVGVAKYRLLLKHTVYCKYTLF